MRASPRRSGRWSSCKIRWVGWGEGDVGWGAVDQELSESIVALQRQVEHSHNQVGVLWVGRGVRLQGVWGGRWHDKQQHEKGSETTTALRWQRSIN